MVTFSPLLNLPILAVRATITERACSPSLLLSICFFAYLLAISSFVVVEAFYGQHFVSILWLTWVYRRSESLSAFLVDSIDYDLLTPIKDHLVAG